MQTNHQNSFTSSIPIRYVKKLNFLDTPDNWLEKMVPPVPPATAMYPGLPELTLGGSALIVTDYWVDPILYDLAHTAAQLNKDKNAGKPEKKEKPTKQQLKELKEQVIMQNSE